MNISYKNTNNSNPTIKSSRSIWRVDFAGFQYFPKSREIKFDKQTQKLTPTLAAVLEHLIERQGEIILRQEITQAAWFGRKEVSRDNFYQVIKRLRATLNDTRKPCKIIVNSSKNVYALHPKVTIHYKKIKHNRRKLVWQAMILITLLAMASSLTNLFLLSEKSQNKVVDATRYKAVDYQTLVGLKGQILRPTASPDASIAVFMHKASDSKGWSLVAKRMGTEDYSTLVAFSDSTAHREPAFSPTGRQLAWVSVERKKTTKCSIMIADFNPQDLSLTNLQVVADCTMFYLGRTPQWKTESILLFSIQPNFGKPSIIVEFDLVTKNQSVITTSLDAGYGDYSLFYNRSSNKMAYLRQSLSTGMGTELRVYDFATKEDVIVKIYGDALYTVAWVNEHQLLTNAQHGLEVISLDGKAYPIDSKRMIVENYPFTITENHIGVVKGDLYARDINVINLVNNTIDSRLSSNSHDYKAVMARESEDVAFVSFRNGQRQVFITINQTPIQLTHFIENKYIYDLAISPNANFVAIAILNQLTLLNRHGKVLFQSPYSIKGMSFSPDGKSLLFGITAEDGKWINRVDLNNFSESIITHGFMPKFDQNGDIYFFRDIKNTKTHVLYKITKSGNIIRLFGVPVQLDHSTSFDIINNQIYYVIKDEQEDGNLMLISEDLTTRKITKIIPMNSRKFSFNKDATKLVTTKEGNVQNNLVSFRLVEEVNNKN